MPNYNNTMSNEMGGELEGYSKELQPCTTEYNEPGWRGGDKGTCFIGSNAKDKAQAELDGREIPVDETDIGLSPKEKRDLADSTAAADSAKAVADSAQAVADSVMEAENSPSNEAFPPRERPGL